MRFCNNQLISRYRNVGQGGVKIKDFRKVVEDAEVGIMWLKDIPGEIEEVAVRDFNKVRAAHFAKLNTMKQNDPSAKVKAKFKFRSKRDSQHSFEVRARDMKRFIAWLKIKSWSGPEGIPQKVEAAVRFIRDRFGHFYVALPRQVAKRDENQAPRSQEGIVALDPEACLALSSFKD